MWIAGMALGRGCQTMSHALTFPMLLVLFWSRYCLLSSCMATTLPLAQAESGPGQMLGKVQGNGAGIAAEQGLVPLAHLPQDEANTVFSAAMGRLPVELDVSVPVRNFRVRNLLALEPSDLVETVWEHGEDVPLAAGRVQLAWSEFEVIDTQLAVRVTRLA
jgi:flagellar motor switch/type III secretory pathway protein FliN